MSPMFPVWFVTYVPGPDLILRLTLSATGTRSNPQEFRESLVADTHLATDQFSRSVLISKSIGSMKGALDAIQSPEKQSVRLAHHGRNREWGIRRLDDRARGADAPGEVASRSG